MKMLFLPQIAQNKTVENADDQHIQVINKSNELMNTCRFLVNAKDVE